MGMSCPSKPPIIGFLTALNRPPARQLTSAPFWQTTGAHIRGACLCAEPKACKTRENLGPEFKIVLSIDMWYYICIYILWYYDILCDMLVMCISLVTLGKDVQSGHWWHGAQECTSITAFGPGIWAPFELSETIPKDFETPVLTTATQDFLSTCFPLCTTGGVPTFFMFQQLF